MKAVLFGSIGTLIETSDIQRKCFNEAFKKENLNWYWDRYLYRKLLKKSGGTKRIEDFSRKIGVRVDSEKIWKVKTSIFEKKIYSNKNLIRKGVMKIFRYAKSENLKIGLVTTTTKKNIDVVFRTLNGQIRKRDFNFIGDKNLIKRPKPQPDIYIKALEVMNLKKSDCIAIEDSVESAKSAIKAGIKCVAFPGDYHDDEDFNFCDKVVKELSISILR